MSALNSTPHSNSRDAVVTYETLRNQPYRLETIEEDSSRIVAGVGTLLAGAATVAATAVDVATNILTLGNGTSLRKPAASATADQAKKAYSGKSSNVRHVEIELTQADQDEIDTQTRFTEELIKEDITNDRYKKSENGPYIYKVEIKKITLAPNKEIELSYFIFMPVDDAGKPDVSKAKRIKLFKLEDQKALATEALLTEKATKWLILYKAIGDKGFGSCKLVVIDVLEGAVHGYVTKPRGEITLDDESQADMIFDKIPKEVLDIVKKPQKEGEKDSTPNGSTDKTFNYKFEKKSGPALETDGPAASQGTIAQLPPGGSTIPIGSSNPLAGRVIPLPNQEDDNSLKAPAVVPEVAPRILARRAAARLKKTQRERDRPSVEAPAAAKLPASAKPSASPSLQLSEEDGMEHIITPAAAKPEKTVASPSPQLSAEEEDAELASLRAEFNSL